MKNDYFPYELGFFPIDEERLVFEPYQRGEVPGLVSRMIREWNPRALSTITLARMDVPDTWAVVDGGQRIRAARTMGLAELPGCEHTGMSYVERATLFAVMDHRRALTAFDRFAADIERQDSTALTCRSVSEEFGIELTSRESGDPNQCRAVATCMAIVNTRGADGYRLVLRVAREWLPQERLKNDLLAGLSSFLPHLSQRELRTFQSRLDDWNLSAVEREVSRRMRNAARGSGGAAGRWRSVFEDILRGKVEVSESMTEALRSQVVSGKAESRELTTNERTGR